MVPKIEFRYSHLYDEHFKKSRKFNMVSKKKFTERAVKIYIKNLEREWNKKGDKILLELEKFTNLQWHEQKIICYVVNNAIPFSDPLTIPFYGKIDFAIDILTHELIHQIYTQGDNLKKNKKAWHHLFKKYKKETWNTIIHIPLHAIHSAIYLKFFGEDRLERNIKLFKDLPDYALSWEIVQKEGYKNIISEFKKK